SVGGLVVFSSVGAFSATRRATNLAGALPPGVRPPAAAAPEIVKALPSAVHSAYVGAFAASLRPVFAVAAGISVVAFVLSWFLREVPLRKSAEAEGVAEHFAMPREDESLPELERIVATRSEERRVGREG